MRQRVSDDNERVLAVAEVEVHELAGDDVGVRVEDHRGEDLAGDLAGPLGRVAALDLSGVGTEDGNRNVLVRVCAQEVELLLARVHAEHFDSHEADRAEGALDDGLIDQVDVDVVRAGG